VIEAKKYLLSEIVAMIKQREPGEYTLVDIDKQFRIRHVFQDVKSQKLSMKKD